MKVLKFGGSSVATATNISRVLDIVGGAASGGERILLVCSAISGCTDALLSLKTLGAEEGSKVLDTLRARHSDIITRLFSGKERGEVEESIEKLFAEIPLEKKHPETFGELLSTTIIAAKLRCEGYRAMWLDARELVLVGKDGLVDRERTYGRVREVVKAEGGAEIFVVPGFIARDSEGEACTLGRGGSDYSAALFAAALEARSLEIWTDVPGMMTTNPKDCPGARTIPSLSFEAALCMAENGAKVLYAPSVNPAKEKNIPIEVRNTFDPAGAFTTIQTPTQKAPQGEVCVALARDGGKLCLVFEGKAPDVEGRISSALREDGICALEIRTEDNCVFAKVGEEVAPQACAAIHKEFFETPALTGIDLYIAGNGAVGKALVELVHEGSAARRSGKALRVVEISSDRAFASRVLESAPRRAVFVDATNSEDIYKYYVPLLEKGINIVSSNRRSLAVPYVEYAAMKSAALRGGSFLRYESTVGAAMPVLKMLKLCAQSGDRIESIEAVVSCTLNYILSSPLGFDQALEKAKSIGLTEKDPRSDLEGEDALRKLLILSREAGVPLEREDVEIEAVDKSSIRSGVAQRFVATLNRDAKGYTASIRLRTVDESHPAYWLRGTDNAIVFRSALHPSPMVLQGAGEGARMAAASILNDILL